MLENCFMTDEKMVSIIVPVYNTKNYITECLNSIINQDYTKLQIIIVDDGSTDGSGLLCDKYATKDNRIEVLHKENGGLVSARKQGLNKAIGDYVSFVDSDDFIEENMISTLVESIEKNNADFVHSGHTEFSDSIERVFVDFDETVYEINGKEDSIYFIKNHLLNLKNEKRMSNSICTKLFKRELIDKCYRKLNDEQQLGEDALCSCRCIFESRTIVLLPVSLYRYRIFEESMSHSEPNQMLSKQLSLCYEMSKILSEYGCFDSVKDEIYEYLLASLLPVIKKDDNREFLLTQFYLQDINDFIGKRVIIYGSGAVGQDYELQLRLNGIDVICFADKFTQKKYVLNREVIRPRDILNIDNYDVILIAINNKSLGEDIKKDLIGLGIKSDKICWVKPQKYY